MAKRLSIVNILSCVWILFMALYSSSSRGDCLQGRSSWCYLAFDSYLHKTSKHFPTTTTSTNVVSCCLSSSCISAYLPQLAWEKSISLPTYLPVTLVISQSTRFTLIMINIVIPGFITTQSVFSQLENEVCITWPTWCRDFFPECSFMWRDGGLIPSTVLLHSLVLQMLLL